MRADDERIPREKGLFVNSQSKFHSRKAVEFSMRNKRNLVWEKKKRGTNRDKEQ